MYVIWIKFLEAKVKSFLFIFIFFKYNNWSMQI